MTTLNVGCGSDTWGDIRLDVERSPPDYFVHYKKSTANIIADAQNLPFRDEVFTELRAYQVLEHLPNPIKALKEWRRVSEKIDITFPINSYVLHSSWFIPFWITPSDLSHLLELKQRQKKHPSQINMETLTPILRRFGFNHIHTEKLTRPILKLMPYKIKSKFFTTITRRFRRTSSWRVIAW